MARLIQLLLTLAATNLLLPLVSAVPTPADVFLAEEDNVNTCGDSTFVDTTTKYSPKIRDCEAIATQVLKEATFWYSYPEQAPSQGGWDRIEKVGTCVFAVRTTVEEADGGSKVGNTDVADLIRDSIARFGKDEKVAAQGVMKCANGMVEAETEWAILRASV
ncbi:putative necrosis-inducing factor-domain-containing protein [Peziza echinospora]|nr:putative necrosis-inducing factor-domain-containing protein [Peziza echinospora]